MPVATEPYSDTKEHVLKQAYTGEREGLLRFINHRISAFEDAEDILQDVYYELAEHYNPMAPIERVAAWLYHVASNKITDWYRKKRSDRLDDINVNNNSDSEDESLLLADLIPSFDTPADKKLFLDMVSDTLSEALEQLPENQREVFVMHELEGVSLNDIATLTNMNLKTVISRKRYAVLFLREYMQDLYDELLNN